MREEAEFVQARLKSSTLTECAPKLSLRLGEPIPRFQSSRPDSMMEDSVPEQTVPAPASPRRKKMPRVQAKATAVYRLA